jgi:hypothetical protein
MNEYSALKLCNTRRAKHLLITLDQLQEMLNGAVMHALDQLCEMRDAAT